MFKCRKGRKKNFREKKGKCKAKLKFPSGQGRGLKGKKGRKHFERRKESLKQNWNYPQGRVEVQVEKKSMKKENL